MNKKDKKFIIAICIVVLLIILAVVLWSNRKEEELESNAEAPTEINLPTAGIFGDLSDNAGSTSSSTEGTSDSDKESEDAKDASTAIIYSSPSFKLSGSTVAVVGDSIVECDGFETSREPGVVMHGFQTFIHKNGAEKAANFGSSGSSFAHAKGSDDDEIVDIVTKNDFSSYDMVMVFGGVNDFMFKDTPLGSISSGDYDISTYYGALQTMMENLITNYPNTAIVLCTPIQCAGSSTPNSLGLTLADYAQATRDVANHYNIPLCDFFSYVGFTEADAETLTQDGLHPNNDGYFYVCTEVLIPFLSEL